MGPDLGERVQDRVAVPERDKPLGRGQRGYDQTGEARTTGNKFRIVINPLSINTSMISPLDLVDLCTFLSHHDLVRNTPS